MPKRCCDSHLESQVRNLKKQLRFVFLSFILLGLLSGPESPALSERSDVAAAFRTMQTHEQVQETLRQVAGEIHRMKTVRLLGTDTYHLVVQLKTNRGGHELISDLGPVRDLRRLHLGLGDPIRLLGKVSAVDGKPILIAEKLMVRGQIHQVRRQAQLDLAEKGRNRPSSDFRGARQ